MLPTFINCPRNLFVKISCGINSTIRKWRDCVWVYSQLRGVPGGLACGGHWKWLTSGGRSMFLGHWEWGQFQKNSIQFQRRPGQWQHLWSECTGSQRVKVPWVFTVDPTSWPDTTFSFTVCVAALAGKRQVYSMWNYFLPQVQAYQPNRKLWALFITLAHSLMRLMWVLGCNYLP